MSRHSNTLTNRDYYFIYTKISLPVWELENSGKVRLLHPK